jgi:hypothetical protein
MTRGGNISQIFASGTMSDTRRRDLALAPCRGAVPQCHQKVNNELGLSKQNALP